MTHDERFHLDNGRPAGMSPMDTMPGDDAERMRAEGQALLDAADEAISRALSRDSGQFLAQGRQTGGQ
jgi:hypothetical protein